jgi:hypothetical protein
MACAILFATTASSIWRTTMRCSSSTRPVFSSRARRRAAWRGNTPARQVRSQVPDRRRQLFAPRSCIHRSRAVSSEGMDRRSGSPQSRIRASRHRLCDQTEACDGNDRTRDSRVRPVQVGCRRYGLRCWQHRTATTPGRQRLCTRGQQRSCFQFLGQAAIGLRHRRDAALVRLETPVCRGDGTKGLRLHDRCYLELADLDAGQFSSANDGLWTRGLLIRRRVADGDLAFYC